MKIQLYKIFKKKKNIIIGAIHFPPLLGYPDSPGLDLALKDALYDLKALEKGGVDAIIFENNYDIPHKVLVDPSIVASMTFLGEKLRKATKLPLGINVLWNDYQASLSMAKILNLQFIRIPVFVDKIKTSCGVIKGEPKKITAFRKLIKAEKVAILTDIHVKHSQILSKHTLFVSAKLAIKNHSDAVILTGNWTGDAPDINQLKNLRKDIGTFPILLGSGVDKDNVSNLFNYADGAIVSTSLKKGGRRKTEINVKAYSQRININKVKKLIKKLS